MAILLGHDKPLAEMSALQSIATAPRTGETIAGVWVSKTGKLLHETAVCWRRGLEGVEDDSCPVNDGDCQGWSAGGDCFVYPSHWRPADA